MNKKVIKEKLLAFRDAIDGLLGELDKSEGETSSVPRQRRNLKKERVLTFSRFYNKSNGQKRVIK